MASRATDAEVRAVMDVAADLSVSRQLKTAAALVNYVVSVDTGGILTGDLQKEVEIYLTAHFVALKDPQLQTKNTGKAGGTFQGQTGKGFELTWWGQQAMTLDITGTLSSMNKNPRMPVQMVWLGTDPADLVVPSDLRP